MRLILSSQIKQWGMLLLSSILLLPLSLEAQSEDSTLLAQPNFHVLREMEDYSYLKNKSKYEKDFLDPIKFIPLNNKKDIYLSFGGQLRLRYEHFTNRFWIAENDINFYSQRLALYSNLALGKNFRIYGEVYHGYTSHMKEIVQYDELDLFQGFVEYKAQLSKTNKISVRLGRQELPLGDSRLVGIRDGPNIRSSFDMAKLHITSKNYNIQAFFGKEVMSNFYVFDNTSNLFNSSAVNPSLWGIYSQFKIKGDIGKNELYYLGFHTNIAAFSDVVGEEKRHTVGLRRFGTIHKKITYNTEAIYQFGTISGSDINAFSIATDGYYKFNTLKWKPQIGVKLEYSSGDKRQGDGKIQTFNPMFVNVGHYGLSGTITPANLISIHPSAKALINNKLYLYVEWAFFWKNSKNDAVYRPTRFIYIPVNNVSSNAKGHQFGFIASYQLNRHFSFNINSSYFIPSEFLKRNHRGENIFHLAATINYKF